MAVTGQKDKKESIPAVQETPPVNIVPPGTDGVGVDKIRDLLFGTQMQDYDRRFSKLEDRFQQRFREIESDPARNLGTFESSTKKNVESLADQLREEKNLRADADKDCVAPIATT